MVEGLSCLEKLQKFKIFYFISRKCTMAINQSTSGKSSSISTITNKLGHHIHNSAISLSDLWTLHGLQSQNRLKKLFSPNVPLLISFLLHCYQLNSWFFDCHTANIYFFSFHLSTDFRQTFYSYHHSWLFVLWRWNFFFNSTKILLL